MRRECAPILGRPVACRTWCTCAKPVPPEHLSLRSFRTERDLVSSSWICWMCAVWQLQELSHEAETFLFLSCPLENRYCWFAQSVCVCVCVPPEWVSFLVFVCFCGFCNIHSIPQPCLQETRKPGKICGTSSGSRRMSRSSAKSKSPMTTLRSFRWCPISSGTESSQSCQSILIAKIDDRYRKYIEKMLNTYRILQNICCWSVYKLPQSLVEHIPLMFLIFHGAPGASSMIQVCIEHGHWHLI